MDRSNEAQATVGKLWEEHLAAAFPAALRGAEPAGVDMVMLDANIAGCVLTWQKTGGDLDADRQRILRSRLSDLDRLLPLLVETNEIHYCQRLHRLAVLTSEHGPVPTD
ncbi:hypothetical protein [Streptomyces hygroscopicus]|uniref:hypothetical protein n=1 Tax=Streptomyces hygroscopicus TaxID=1912 RepID=UPI001FCAAFA4|nr:hypothetical protein [Streptomyces hygroscopicus]BDH12661.1 hypothetical protein HOK021_38400 [Streptomyces hygroscopicus]